MAQPLFQIDDPDDHRRIREVFAAADYTDREIVTTLRMGDLSVRQARQLPVLLRRTNGRRPLDTLIRLFILGVDEDLGGVRAALDPMTPEQWAHYGLLNLDGDRVRGTVQIRYYRGMLIAFDYVHREPSLPADFVMGVSASSVMLAGMTIRRPSRLTLDLGTGSGIQALAAAEHSEQVLATDVSPRAVEMAKFNFRFNDIDAEAVEGSFFEPVEGRRFDLIVSNPPYIVAPEPTHFFLHGGLESDGVCRKLAHEAPSLLSDGGYFQFLANWAVVAGEEWQERLASWFTDSGCDAWVMVSQIFEPDEYASTWIEGPASATDLATAFDEWMAFFERERIEGIGFGLVTMRRNPGTSNWLRVEDGPDKMTFPCGDDMARGFQTRAFLTRASDQDLLMLMPILAPDVRLEEESSPNENGWQPAVRRLRRTSGLQYEGVIDAPGVEMLARCDGTRRMSDLVGEVASALGANPDDMPALLKTVRLFLEQGFLLLPEETSG